MLQQSLDPQRQQQAREYARLTRWLFLAELVLSAVFLLVLLLSGLSGGLRGILDLPQPAKVETPLLVLGAAKDASITVREVEATARAYGTQAEFFPDMAHDLMLEPGWQSVADRILSWLHERGL